MTALLPITTCKELISRAALHSCRAEALLLLKHILSAFTVLSLFS